jgi:hypothetical protein
MKFDEVNRFRGLVELPTLIGATDSSDALLEHGCVKIGVLVSSVAVIQTNSSMLRRPLRERVIIQREKLEKGIRFLT